MRLRASVLSVLETRQRWGRSMTDFIERYGNIFNSDAASIVVTVNCRGFMGKGMALECALRLPEVEQAYVAAARARQIVIGSMTWVAASSSKEIVLFPTKDDYKLPSRMAYIDAGLSALRSDLAVRKPASLALPRLGSELGGLDWGHVLPRVVAALDGLPLRIELWSFSRTIIDPAAEDLIARVEVGLLDATAATRIPMSKLSDLIAYARSHPISGYADLLGLQGFGKTSLKKLIAWQQQASGSSATLFD